MFKYLFALLIAPLLRPVFNAMLLLVVVTFAVTVPARLWVMYIGPRPSYHMITVLNVATSISLFCVVVMWRLRRRQAGRRTSLTR